MVWTRVGVSSSGAQDKGSVIAKKKHAIDVDLISTTVHELKTPLTLISGIASMLREEDFGKLKPEQRRYIGRMLDTSDRLLRIIDSLLVIGKAEHGRQPINLRPISMTSIVRQATLELEPFISEKNINLSIQHRRQMPPVLADKDFLHHIIYNLIDNAIKYSKPNSNIKIRFQLVTQGIKLHVRDEGVGVLPSEIKTIFEKFGTSSQPVQAHAGSSGLGLYIAKNLLDLQGGSIGVATLTDGSCFHITLPRVRQLSLFKGESL